ncbi:MAG: hypothetical protein LBT01_08745 [Spirochaetaceae bacterium]|jgi:hypothetical protein|nr:hypothetical protein [Spirochaetaceae bacterium]
MKHSTQKSMPKPTLLPLAPKVLLRKTLLRYPHILTRRARWVTLKSNKLAGQSTAIVENNSDMQVPLTSFDEEVVIYNRLLQMLDSVKHAHELPHGERIKIQNQEKPQILRIDAEKKSAKDAKKSQFISRFYDYSRPFADNLKMSKKKVHRYTQIDTDEEIWELKICVNLCPSVDKFLMRPPCEVPL